MGVVSGDPRSTKIGLMAELYQQVHIQGYSLVPPGFPNSTEQQPRQTRQKEAYQLVENLSKFFCIRALAYFQVPPLGVVVKKNGVHSE